MSPRVPARPLPLLATVAYLVATAAGPGLHALLGHGGHAAHAHREHAAHGHGAHAHAGCGHSHAPSGHGHSGGAGGAETAPDGHDRDGHRHDDHDCVVCQFLALVQGPVDPPAVGGGGVLLTVVRPGRECVPERLPGPVARTRGPPAVG